jgi:hypothetical protein
MYLFLLNYVKKLKNNAKILCAHNKIYIFVNQTKSF